MKHLVYRNILGHNPKKREVSIEEISDRTRSKISRKWICKYFIRDSYSDGSEKKLRKWIKETEAECKKNCHILRRLDSRTGENMMICKVLGDFFVIAGRTAYKIAYVNEVRIRVNSPE